MPRKARADMPITQEVRQEIEHIVDARLAGRVERSLERLADAQTQLTVRVDQLGERMDQFGERMNQLGAKVDTLVEAQTRTELGLQRMEAAVAKMAEGLTDTRNELGGLSRTMSYALENEAYRAVTALLQERLGVSVTERIARADIGGEEVNLFARGTRGGRDVIVVGETKLRSDPRSYLPDYVERLFRQIERKVQAVRAENPGIPVVKVLLTHFATKAFVEEAAACDITVIQSHEW